MKLKSRGISALLTAVMMLSMTACAGQSKSSEKPAAKQLVESDNTESSIWQPSTDRPSPAESSVESVSDTESEDSTEEMLPEEFQDNGIFSAYYSDAYKRLQNMTLDEKIGQMLWAGCPAAEALETARSYHLGGYVLFGDFFSGKSKEQVIDDILQIDNSQKIPMAIAVDEEGGTVSRLSSNKQLTEHSFESPRDLYKNGGMAYIQTDAAEKAALLKELKINVNLAPVCDIAVNSSDFMYDRSLGESPELTGEFVKVVTEISQTGGVSVTLKHFPGYGSNVDTHTGIAVDNRSYEEFQTKDFVPFKSGIQAGADYVMVSHNIVNCMDAASPASLSPKVHQILREELGFTGLIVTDDLNMGAIKQYAGSHTPAVAAVLAGNDVVLISSTMLDESLQSITKAVQNNEIDIKTIDRSVMRILAWKMYKGML